MFQGEDYTDKMKAFDKLVKAKSREINHNLEDDYIIIPQNNIVKFIPEKDADKKHVEIARNIFHSIWGEKTQ